MTKTTYQFSVANGPEETYEDRIPLMGKADYSDKAVRARLEWLQKKTSVSFRCLGKISDPIETYKGNIENLIGVAQVPIGVIGPLRVNGEYALGDFYVPLATTEGVLVNSFHRGARVITKSGGAQVKVLRKEMHVSPVVKLDSLKETQDFLKWISEHFQEIKKEAEKTSRHCKLLRISPRIIGNSVILKFSYDTEDAMGMNMITIASDSAIHFIRKRYRLKIAFPRSNFSSDKKNSAHIFSEGYGRTVHAEAEVPEALIRYFGTTAREMFKYYLLQLEASMLAGMQGVNGQIANGIAAVFIATGQDAAQVVNSAVGISKCELIKKRGLYISVELLELLVGTTGGGTRRGYAVECLKLMGCYGSGKADKFSEIIGALVLAGELSILGALASGTFVKAHTMYGRPQLK